MTPTKKVKLTGVVTNVAWTNPHMRVYVDVTDASGKVTNWNLELTSPNSVRRQGWGRNDLKMGDKVIFEGYAGKVVESRGSLLSIAKVGDTGSPAVRSGWTAGEELSNVNAMQDAECRSESRVLAARRFLCGHRRRSAARASATAAQRRPRRGAGAAGLLHDRGRGRQRRRAHRSGGCGSRGQPVLRR